MRKLWAIGILAFGFDAFQIHAAVLFPSVMAPLREAIVEEIAILTNSPSLTREESRQLRLLNQARRNLSRAGRPSLFGDVQILASLNSSLTRAFPEGDFEPLLQTALADYTALLAQSAFEMGTNIGTLPPSTATALASNTVAEVITMLDALDPAAGVSTGVRTLTRAATRLRSAEGFLTRARSPVNRGNRLTAFADGRRFTASPGGISANYNPGGESLTVVGRESGTGSRSIQLVINNVTPGTTSHSFGAPGAGSYATYSSSSPTNSIGLTSLSGNVTVTLNVASGVVTGRFSFDAGDPFSGQTPVRVTGGDFSVRLPSP